MIKSGTVKSVLLLAFIGTVLIALVEPIAGYTMGQEKIMGQKDTTALYPDNRSMMQSSMGEHAAKGTYSISRTAQNASLSNINIDCARFWLEKAIKLHEVHLKNPKTATKESQMEMMDQMMRAYEYLTGENITMGLMNMTADYAPVRHEQLYTMPSQVNVDCARFWLEKAIKLHEVHLKNPKTATNESQMEMMNQMTQAYKYLTGEGMTKELPQNASLSNINVDCARFWLEKAIKLHEVHLKNPNTATNESQMKMMDQMMKAYKYIKGENATMKTTNMTGSHMRLGRYE